MKKLSSDERLKRLNADLDKMLSVAGIVREYENIEDKEYAKLTLFGLTKKEAKAWLKREPNYISRRKVTDSRTDEDETEPKQLGFGAAKRTLYEIAKEKREKLRFFASAKTT